MNGPLANSFIHPTPPCHVLRFLEKIITHPSGDRHDRCVLLDEVRDKGTLLLICNLIVVSLLVACDVTVHLVHTDAKLLDTGQVDQMGTLTCLALDLTSFVIAPGDCSGELPSGGTMIKEQSAQDAPVILSLMESRWPGAAMMA